ncbi:MAG: hydrogenase iron-sulfur subunit [Candidatus Nanohalobium sp.]
MSDEVDEEERERLKEMIKKQRQQMKEDRWSFKEKDGEKVLEHEETEQEKASEEVEENLSEKDDGEAETGVEEEGKEEFSGKEEKEWRPLIVALLCNWCSYEGADKAGGSKLDVPSNVLPVKFMCSSRVDFDLVVKALEWGADGVMVLGCHPGDCHYKEGNYHTLRRKHLFDELIDGLGINTDRVMLDWVSAGEGKKYSQVTREMADRVMELGPLKEVGENAS